MNKHVHTSCSEVANHSCASRVYLPQNRGKQCNTCNTWLHGFSAELAIACLPRPLQECAGRGVLKLPRHITHHQRYTNRLLKSDTISDYQQLHAVFRTQHPISPTIQIGCNRWLNSPVIHLAGLVALIPTLF